jgi:predicted branched-subunit amino acid permease
VTDATDGPAARRTSIVRDGITVGLATGAYGLSFGAIAVAAGLSVLQTCALSFVMFTGASQFAFVGIVASGGGALSGAATALLLGVRNGLYGVRLGPLLGWTGWRRVTAAHLVIDESTAMSVNRETQADVRTGFVSTGASVFVLWNLATLVGALAGRALGDPRTLGLDAAVGGAFLALLWPRLRDRTNQLVAVLSVGVALSLVPFTPAGFPVLAAAVVALIVGLGGRGADPTELPDAGDLPGGGRRP